MAKASDQSILEMLSRIWRQQWLMLEEHKIGAALGDDPEHLHRLRVALRQTRAVLWAFQDDLPHAEGLAAEFKWLSTASGAVRDLDVLLINLRTWAAASEQAAGMALLPIVAQLTKERAVAQRRLRRALVSQRYRKLTLQWQSFMMALPETAVDIGTAPAREVVALKIAKQSLRLVKGGLAIQRSTPSSLLHTLRIRGKRLRYLAESFAPLLGRRRGYRSFVPVLKQLQQVLGDYRDNDLASARLSGLIEQAAKWPQAHPWLLTWREELEVRKRRSRAAIDPAVAAFTEACRHLPD